MTWATGAALVAALAVALAGLAGCASQATTDSTPSPTAISVPAAGATATDASSVSSTSGATTTDAASVSSTSGAASTTTPSSAAGGDLSAVKISVDHVADLDQPIAMALRRGDATLYVAERTGRVRAIRDGQLDPSPVLDMSTLTKAGGEQGLLGMAFSPDGQFLYLDYTDVKGDSHVDEYAVAADGSIAASSRRQVLFQAQPYPNHNGGGLAFGPDGYLYIGFGDGGSEGDPQRRGLDLSTWLGKLLRIDPRPDGDQPYRVPADNPFVGRSGVKPEIWAYGLRNPWRFSFDAATGDLWIGDVGQNTLEEVDEGPGSAGGGRGLNYGWSAFEGTSRYNHDQSPDGTVGPVYEYEHSGDPGGCTISGGYVYRGQAIPALRGAYLFGDYCVAGVRAFPTGVENPAATVLATTPSALVSFGQGPDDELYTLSLNGGVYRIDPA